MKKIKSEIIICLTDGYHEPHYYFQFGDDKYGELHLTEFLCQPHEITYFFFTIYYDDISEESDEYIFLCNFETMNKKDRIKNFDKLVKIYRGTYSD